MGTRGEERKEAGLVEEDGDAGEEEGAGCVAANKLSPAKMLSTVRSMSVRSA